MPLPPEIADCLREARVALSGAEAAMEIVLRARDGRLQDAQKREKDALETVNQADNEISNLKATNASAEAKIDKLEAKLQAKRQEVAVLREQLEGYSGPLSDIPAPTIAPAAAIRDSGAGADSGAGGSPRRKPSTRLDEGGGAIADRSPPQKESAPTGGPAGRSRSRSRSPSHGSEGSRSSRSGHHRQGARKDGGGSRSRAREAAGGGGAAAGGGSPTRRKRDRSRSGSRAASGSGSPRRGGRRSRSRSGPRHCSRSHSRRSCSSDSRSGSDRGGSRPPWKSRGGDRDRGRDREPRGKGSRGKGGGKGAGRPDSGAPRDVPLCISFVMGRCQWGNQCRDRHPDEENCRAAKETLVSKPCRFGDQCKRNDCVFRHPGRSPKR